MRRVHKPSWEPLDKRFVALASRFHGTVAAAAAPRRPGPRLAGIGAAIGRASAWDRGRRRPRRGQHRVTTAGRNPAIRFKVVLRFRECMIMISLA